MFVRNVKPSKNFALNRLKAAVPASRSDGVPLPQYSQMRVLFWTSRGICTIASLRRHAGSLDGPHMLVALKPPELFIAMPTSVGHQPSDGFRNPDNDPA